MLWVIFALLVVLALWFVLPPLWQKGEERKRDELRAANVLVYQDQYRELEADLRNGLISEESYRQDKDELERRLLDDVAASRDLISNPASSVTMRKLAYAIGAAIPVTAIALYLYVGNPKALTPQPASQSAPPFAGQQGAMTQQQIQANVAKLAQRLEQNPNDAQGWIMLGRSYTAMERFSDAANAYEHATSLTTNDANVWADYAEAQAMANGQRMAGKPLEAANRALQLDPKNEKALALAGSAAYEAADYQKAIDYWQKLLPLLPANSEAAKTVSDQLAKARELAAGRGSR
ncbi:MAG TPA: c-type cytochrome biogenesis protein CcmI [Pyrinomonadaceae bacterium]|nr:c-type cytochrome biogenesis protein CcmI [Pyrinomonadaceae bacterium]